MYLVIALPPFESGVFHYSVTDEAFDVLRLNSRGVDGAAIAFRCSWLEYWLVPTELIATTL